MRGGERHPEESDHGAHTLRVLDGVVVGIAGDDVFVELGPRMQGVISKRSFDEEPREGDSFLFTLRGQEESLWVLSLVEEETLATWEEMEEGSVVRAHVVRARAGGLEVKVGQLHAFLPASETGLPRGQKPSTLVGRNVTCEVLEVDPERQRCILSRKVVQKREHKDPHQREVSGVAPGQVVQGRVSRIEPYGVFVRFGRGLEGLVHISNLSHDRIEHPSAVVKKGESIEAKVLYVKRSGKRIALGVKQMHESPWLDFARETDDDEVLEGEVVRVEEWGAFVRVRRGIEGLVHASESGLGRDRTMRAHVVVGQRIAVRVLAIDPERERLSLSMLHRDGARIQLEEAGARELLESDAPANNEGLRSSLGSLLRDALGGPKEDPAGA